MSQPGREVALKVISADRKFDRSFRRILVAPLTMANVRMSGV